MLNGWTITSGILCVLFVAAATFGQEQSDSHIITVTKEIDVAKLNENVEDLTKTVKDLTKTVEKLWENWKKQSQELMKEQKGSLTGNM